MTSAVTETRPASPPPPGETTVAAAERPPYPWLTLLTILLSFPFTLFYWASLASEEASAQFAVFVPDGYQIWRWWLWGLLTSVFPHGDPIHLGFNLYWQWHLGSRIEQTMGRWWWLFFFVSASIVSSGAQLAVSDDTGIGLSGALYAFFGFMWPASRRYPTYRAFLTRRTVNLLIFWLGLCVVMTWLEVWAIGNAAHIAGLLFGLLVSGAVTLRWHPALTRPALAVLCLACLAPVFWCPWSGLWTAVQGDRAFAADRYEAAIDPYERSLRMGLEAPDWVLHNLAWCYYERDRVSEFLSTYDRLEALNPAYANDLREALGLEIRERSREEMIADLRGVFSGGGVASETASAPTTRP